MEDEPLATKEAKEVAEPLSRSYRRSPLKWPKMLHVDPGREFMGAVNQLLAKHGRGQARLCGHPPGPGDRGAIQPDLG